MSAYHSNPTYRVRALFDALMRTLQVWGTKNTSTTEKGIAEMAAELTAMDAA